MEHGLCLTIFAGSPILQDCERRTIAKLFRHRSDERSSIRQRATE